MRPTREQKRVMIRVGGINSYPVRTMRKYIKTDYRFVANAEKGYIPLMSILQSYVKGSGDYFSKENYTSQPRTVKYSINSMQTIQTFCFRQRDSLLIHNNTGRKIMYSGMLSYFGSRKEFKYINMDFGIFSDFFMLDADLDFFTLAVVKLSEIPNIIIDGKYGYIYFPKGSLKVLISKEKFEDKTYMNTYYNPTVRTHMYDRMIYDCRNNNIPMEVVNDSEMLSYIKQKQEKVDLGTNSIIEIMKIGKNLIDEVFGEYKQKVLDYGS